MAKMSTEEFNAARTKGKKQLNIYKVANTAMYEVAYEGGPRPEIFDGAMFTSPVLAQKAIDAYMEQKSPGLAKAMKAA